MNLEFSKEYDDGLTKEVWRFCVREESFSRLVVELDYYCSFDRLTRRHKFVANQDSLYSRLDRRKSVLRKEEVPVMKNANERILKSIVDKVEFR